MSKALTWKNARGCAAIGACLLAVAAGPGATQSWTPLVNQPPDGDQIYRMRLLTDGTVMAQIGGNAHWLRLTPDATGNYANGTWSTTSIAPMATNRFSYPSEVLPSGKVWIFGGENYGPSSDDVWTATGQIWNPVTNTWSEVANFPPVPCFTVTYNATGSVRAGSSSVTKLPSADMSAFVAGWSIAGTGIPAGTTLTAVGPGAKVEMSAVATATGSAVPLQFTGTPPSCFGDVPTMLLPGGKILAGSLVNNSTYLYSIASNSWEFAAQKVYQDSSDEEGWTLLSDGRVMTYDIGPSVQSAASIAELYSPSTNSWTSVSPSDGTATGTFPLLSSAASDYELGPSLHLLDGRIFMIGATGHTALYTPNTNSWAAGPDVIGTLNGVPALFGADDAPAALMPNGHVLLAADAGPTLGAYSPPTQLFDFDPVANTISPVTPALTDPFLPNDSVYNTSMLVLPTGQVLFADGSYQAWVYTPAGAASAQYQPSVSKVKFKANGTFTLTGQQLTGQSAGAAYGDDAEMDENYPIVYLMSGGLVYYCKTTNWNYIGVGSGPATQTVDVECPPSVGAGNYLLEVSAAGIASPPFPITIAAK